MSLAFNFTTMERKKVFISAPVNFDRRSIGSCIAASGYEPVIPAEDTAKAHLQALLTCDGIARLFRWRCSKDCEIEKCVADACGIDTVGIIDSEGNLSVF